MRGVDCARARVQLSSQALVPSRDCSKGMPRSMCVRSENEAGTARRAAGALLIFPFRNDVMGKKAFVSLSLCLSPLSLCTVSSATLG